MARRKLVARPRLGLAITLVGFALLTMTLAPLQEPSRVDAGVVPCPGILAFSIGIRSPCPGQEWSKSYGTSAPGENAYAIRGTADGGFVVAGETQSGPWVFRLDAAGRLLWQRTFEGHQAPQIAIEALPDGGYLFVGRDPAGVDGWVVRLDATGSILWQRTYGGAGDDVFGSMALAPDGGFLLGGWTSSSGSGSADFWVVKLDALGDPVWQRTVGTPAYELVRAIAPTADGGAAAAGEVDLGGSGFGAEYHAVAVRLDGSGTVLWSRRMDASSGSRFWGAAPASDGGVVAGGYLGSKALLVKFDAAGNVAWKRTYGAGTVRSVAATADGGFVASGEVVVSTSKGQDNFDAFLLRVDGTGNPLWMRTYGTQTTLFFAEMAWSVRETTDGGFVFAGRTYAFGAGYNDAWVLRTDPSGLVAPDCPASLGAARAVSAATPKITSTALAPSAGVPSAAAADAASTTAEYAATALAQCTA